MGELLLSTIVISVDDKQLGIKLKKARLEKDFSQEEVGTKIGVTWEMISRYENGRTSPLKHLSKLADIYEKPISYFMTDQPDYAESFDLDQVVAKLKEEGIGYSRSNKNVVKLVEHLSGRGIEDDLMASDKFAEIPSSITDTFKNAFALRVYKGLNIKDGLEIRVGDIAILALEHDIKDDDIVIGYDGMSYKLMKNDPEGLDTPLAVLISIQRNFRQF